MSDHLADAVRDDLREAGAVLRPLVYLGATRRAAAHVLMDPDRAGEMGRGLTRAGLGSNPAVTLEIALERLDSHAPVFARALRTVLRAQTNAPEAVAAAGSLQSPPRLIPLHAAIVAGLAATARVWDMEMDGFRAPMEGATAARPCCRPARHPRCRAHLGGDRRDDRAVRPTADGRRLRRASPIGGRSGLLPVPEGAERTGVRRGATQQLALLGRVGLSTARPPRTGRHPLARQPADQSARA